MIVDFSAAPFDCHTHTSPRRETMKTMKYSLLTIAVIVGSEVVYKCLKYVYSWLQQENCSSLKEDSSHQTGKRIINKVIFFPDQGILSGKVHQDCIPAERNSNNEHQYRYPYHSEFITKPSNETTAPQSPCLKWSTSLIHLVEALDNAKHSLKVCVYFITLQDMVNALLRAKSRGVHVRVILEGQMPSETAVATLRKHNIAVKVSCSSSLMHHKFALVDAPNTQQETTIPGNGGVTELSTKTYFGRLSSYFVSRSLCTQSSLEAENAGSLLLTGSFNWTWTAVVNNFENVILSNDLRLINYYDKEFEHLWENLKA